VKEIVIVPTYKRDAMLYVCLKRIRRVYDGLILVGSDKGHFTDSLIWTIKEHGAELKVLDKHEYHGNTMNAGELLRFAYNAGFDLIHYVEDDAFVDDRWRQWTLDLHERNDRMFCTAGWVGNQQMPYGEATYYLPWIYIPQFSIKKDKLGKIVHHLGWSYYGDMAGWIQHRFPNSLLKKYSTMAVNHYEIDGLIQHIIMEDPSCQVAWNAKPTVMHMGFGGYNRGGYETYESFFEDCGPSFQAGIDKIERLAEDPYWRAAVFTRHIVEKETGPLPRRRFRYRIELPGGWTSLYETDLALTTLPPVINSVRIPKDGKITLISKSG
jgi:hypothetical protein